MREFLSGLFFVCFWIYPRSMRFILAGATNPGELSFDLRVYPSVAVLFWLWRRGGGAAAAAAARARRRWCGNEFSFINTDTQRPRAEPSRAVASQTPVYVGSSKLF